MLKVVFWVGLGKKVGFEGLGGKFESTVSKLVPPSLIRRLASKWGVYRCPSLSEVKRSETVAQD